MEEFSKIFWINNLKEYLKYFRTGLLPTFSSIVYSSPKIEPWFYSSQKEFNQLHLKEGFASIYHMTHEKEKQSLQNAQNISSWTSVAVRCDCHIVVICQLKIWFKRVLIKLIFYSTATHPPSMRACSSHLELPLLAHPYRILYSCLKSLTLITILAKVCLLNSYMLL